MENDRLNTHKQYPDSIAHKTFTDRQTFVVFLERVMEHRQGVNGAYKKYLPSFYDQSKKTKTHL